MNSIKKTIAALFIIPFSLQLNAQADQLTTAFSKSYAFETNKDYEGAIEAIKNTGEKLSYESNMRLGWLYYKVGFNRMAGAYYENAIKQMPGSVDARLAYTYPLNAAGNTDAIITQYKKILETDPFNVTANYNLAYIYYYKNDFTTALKYLDKNLQACPFNYDASLLAAWANVKLTKNTDAEILFNRVLLYAPTDKSAWEGMTYLKADVSKLEKQRKAFSASYELATAGNYTAAIVAMKPVIDKTSYEISLRLGALNYAAGLHEEAIDFYKAAIKLMPNSVEAHLGIASPIAALGNMNDLINEYNTVLGIDPQNTTANYRMGYIYNEKKEFSTAVKYLEKIAAAYPSDYNTQMLLAKTYVNLGNKTEAKAIYSRMLCLYPTDKAASEGFSAQ